MDLWLLVPTSLGNLLPFFPALSLEFEGFEALVFKGFRWFWCFRVCRVLGFGGFRV